MRVIHATPTGKRYTVKTTKKKGRIGAKAKAQPRPGYKKRKRK